MILAGLGFFAGASAAEAATLQLAPGTGVYQAGSTFTARVQVSTGGDAINAAEGTLSFNPAELSVVSVSRGGSIFNLWVTEPTFSNGAGTISFSGGVPTGYSGSVGTVLSVTFRAKNAGSARVSFTNGSVLANDGRGTNVLTAMNGGSYTIQAAASQPEPERIIEYVAPANTPRAPQVTSATHPADGWSTNTTAELRWTVPAGITAMRTLLDGSPSSIPTKVYDTPRSSLTLSDLDEGVSYFHIQFKNEDGWGRVTHYRLAVDTTDPEAFTISAPDEADYAAPEQRIMLQATDTVSGIARYMVKLNADEPYEVAATDVASGTLQLPALAPGYHTVIVEAFDQAGNGLLTTHSFTIEAFAQPVFTEVPAEMSANVIPVIKGQTRPASTVTVQFGLVGSEPATYEVTADAEGAFLFIPSGALPSGVYELMAHAVDQYGAQSASSEVVRIAVQEPGYIRLGSQVVSAMSVIVPLFLLVLLLLFGVWYVFYLLRRFRQTVSVESTEALEIMRREFATVHETLSTETDALRASRKTKKLTKAEDSLVQNVTAALAHAATTVEKELTDVTDLTDND